MDLKELQKNDPLKRMVEKQSQQEEFSPMDPPDAYSPPGIEPVAYEKMPSFLQALMDDHQKSLKEIDAFEKILLQLQQQGLKPDKQIDQGLRQFFSFLDDSIVPHHLREEKILFPILQKRLLEKGEHSQGNPPKTALDMLEDDHIKTMQLAAVTFNFLGLAPRLPDINSRALVLDAALEQGKALVELLRLHMFREDNIVFVLAYQYLSKDEFKTLQAQLS